MQRTEPLLRRKYEAKAPPTPPLSKPASMLTSSVITGSEACISLRLVLQLQDKRCLPAKSMRQNPLEGSASRLTPTRRMPATSCAFVVHQIAVSLALEVRGYYAAPRRASQALLGALRACPVVLSLGCAPRRRRGGGRAGGSPRREARASRAGARSPRPCAQLAAIDRPFHCRCRPIDRYVHRRLFAIDRRLIGRTPCRRRPSPCQEFPVVCGSALPPALCPVPSRLGER